MPYTLLYYTRKERRKKFYIKTRQDQNRAKIHPGEQKIMTKQRLNMKNAD